jgi:hypothetical protein
MHKKTYACASGDSNMQRQLAFGSYKTAWLLCAKLRCSF